MFAVLDFFWAITNLKVEKFHVEPAGKYLLECILVKVTFVTVIDTLLLVGNNEYSSTCKS